MMEPSLLLRTLDTPLHPRNVDVQRAVDAVFAIRAIKTAVLVDHEGYLHSEYDWWMLDARTSSAKTCELCQVMSGQSFRGDVIPYVFPYHTHQAINVIRAKVHLNCRCRLRWAGRMGKIYNTPLGISNPDEAREIYFPSEKQLQTLSPSQFEQLLGFLQSPWES